MRALSFSLFVLFSCSPKDEVEEETGGDTSSGEETGETGDTEDTGADTSAPQPDGHAPAIQSCDAWCELHQVGEEYYGWNLECQVTDPEGLENIWNGRTTVIRGGNQVTDYLVACAAGTGTCTTAFREDEYNVTCSQASSYLFKVWVSDWNGNESAPFTVTGRQQ